MIVDTGKHTRRAFLQRSGQLAVAGAATPFVLNLAALGEAAAFSATDYRALVCVFLYGGNDYANTVVNYDAANHARYATIRSAGASAGGPNIAIPRADLAATALKPAAPLPGGMEYALHPRMTALADLFNKGKAAVQLNVGPLVAPITREQYRSGNTTRYPVPPKLFSHNDQQSVWQSQAAEGSTRGWGGRLGDIALASNGGGSLFTCISVTGNAVFLAGDSALQYQCSSNGAIAVNALKDSFFGTNAAREAFRALIRKPSADLLEDEYAKVVGRSIDAETRVTTGLSGVSLSTAFPTGNPLASQLQAVARLIGARSALEVKRQVFIVSLGGFDLHDNLLNRQPALMGQVSDAIAAFYEATVALGVADKVTTFTASDFGRTLTSNGDGSDHGWGAHHFVVGGAVRGAAFYGTPPPVSAGDTAAPEDQWHVGQGRLLPTTSVEQYAATLARWFGADATDLQAILPNLRNFGGSLGGVPYPVDLGFMG